MAKNNNLTDFVRDLADGFREKLGWESTDKINPQDFRDFVEHSPAAGNLIYGLETLNWTKTLLNNQYETVLCPSELDVNYYFDATTATQRLPLIQFTVQALDPIVGDGEIRIFDDMSNTRIGSISANNTGVVKYVLPVIADISTTQKTAYFPSFSMVGKGNSEAGVRVKMTASFVQIGSAQYPMILSCSTMRGYK